MTINELIEYLEGYRDEIGGDAEVRLMTQQNWPFENTIYGLASSVEITDSDRDEDDLENEACEDEGREDGGAKDDAVLFIVEGRQLGYGTKRAWEVAEH